MTRLAARYTALSPRTQDLAPALALAAYYVGSLIPEAGQLRLPRLAFALVVLPDTRLHRGARAQPHTAPFPLAHLIFLL